MGIGDHRKVLLYRLVQLVRELFPQVHTHCPYALDVKGIDPEDHLLFKALVHTLTVLNRSSRQTPCQRIVSTRSEVLNALQLVVCPQHRLTAQVLESYDALVARFGTAAFTYVQAASALSVSRRTAIRRLRVLEVYTLVQQQDRKTGPTWWTLQPYPQTDPPGTSIFEHMQGEWKDYVGFIEL